MKIYVCVYGGIVSDVYAEKDPASSEPEITVLDIDKEREDADMIQRKWDEIAADGGYARVPAEFYDPLRTL